MTLAITTLLAINVFCCDVAEVNHLYDESGKETLQQVIFWECGEQNNVRDWRRVENTRRHGCRFIILPASDTDGLKVVRVKNVITSHTQHDPERDNREVLPAERRRKF